MKNHQYKLGFMDSETFTKKRPVGLTKKQRDAVLVSMAKKIVENGWVDEECLISGEDADESSPYGIYADIVSDLEDISRIDSGYEIAKTLERRGCCSYNIDSDFIGWLENFDYYFKRAEHANIKAWVAAHDINPKYPVGTVFTTNKDVSPKLPAGTTLYINNLYGEDARYGVWSEPDSKRNALVNFEDLEEIMSIIP